MKRTNVVLNEELVLKAKEFTGIKTTRDLLDYALKDIIRRKNQKKILLLKGKIDWQGNLQNSRKSRIK